MWRRLSHQLRTIPLARSNPKPVGFVVGSSAVPKNLHRSAFVMSRHLSATITVDDVMPIATGHEREELQAALTGKDVLEINYPSGPYGTKLVYLMKKIMLVIQERRCPECLSCFCTARHHSTVNNSTKAFTCLKNLLWSSLIMTKELWDALELKARTNTTLFGSG
ncbi:cytochrome c oxidase subunit 5b-1, mitochondrial-like isoform X2 [Primulina eburnea]|uniref:cytochrome c oxidase subunit 5b-1, mitochondrial-like isoform X2 n=1 Tax=Primulina eburnea TaxID=1245227 RepID=UPI003C6C7C26